MICNKVDLAKSSIISIPKKSKPSNYHSNNSNTCSEYSLTQNLFDPFQSSPPNDFLQKLYKRMQIHEQSVQKINKCS
jgi:dTDP-4-dehydrorhamnose reductase